MESIVWKQCDERQIKGLVSERNEYRRLLGECLYALNVTPRHKLFNTDKNDTYKLAAKIEAAFQRHDNGDAV